MDPSSAQHQEMGGQSLENMLVCSKSQQERKPRPQPEQALKCPRCDSTNTKFCYYNNYSLSQPRYFCKSCRRYWTKGGTLRNVPVGGGCRKNKRPSSSSSSSSVSASASSAISSSKSRTLDQLQPLTPNTINPSSLITSLPVALGYDHHHHHHSNDLSLAFARLQKQAIGQLGFDHDHEHDPRQFSMLGNLGNPDGILGNLGINNNGSGSENPGHVFLSGFLGSQNPNLQNNSYYGFGNGSMEDQHQMDQNNNSANPNSNGVVGHGDHHHHHHQMVIFPYDQEMSNATTTAVTVTTMKQEFCNGRDHDDHQDQINGNRSVLWGFPWQMNGESNMGSSAHHDLDNTGRESWINHAGHNSSWHGLLNSPLM